jgi:small-conductance mechanosensitive channel
MDIWNEIVLPRLQHLTVMEYFTFAVNALVYCFSKSIASHYGEIKDETKMRARLRILHGFNLTVFITFVISLAVNDDRFPADQISQTSLTLLVTYLLIHLAEVLLLSRYGKAITVMGYTRRVETSTSRTLELVACGVILISMMIVLINVWGLTSSLQTTGVVGFLAVLVFTTKDYWLRDFLSGILLISGDRMQRGDVISIPAEDILGIILEIRGLQTSIRDLVRGHDIEIPNSSLLQHRVDFFKENPGGPFRDYVDFKIGYNTSPASINKFLKAVFNKACKESEGIDTDKEPRIALKENEDHSARWRLAYVLKSPHKLLSIRDSVNLAAYELQAEFDLSVGTPVTVEMQNKD